MELKSTFTDDRIILNKILSLVNNKNRCLIHDEDYDTEVHLDKVAECKYFVGHKTHSIIFSLTVGTPIISLAYHPKSTDFMRQFGLEKYSIPDSKLNFNKLASLFDELVLNSDEFGKITFNKSSEFAKLLIKDLENTLHL